MSAAIEREFTSRERMLSLAAIISTSFGVGISFGVGFPLTALTFELWGQPTWMIGLAGAVPGLAVLITLPIAPRVLAWMGPVNAIASGCLIGALGFLALGLFQNPWAWIAIRLLMSAGFAVPWLAGEAWINAVSKEETRGRVIALYAIGFFSGYAIGPVFLQILGLVGPGPFIAGAILTIVSGLPILFGRKLAPSFPHDGAHKIISAFITAPAAMISAFIAGFSEVTILSLIPNVALAAGWTQSPALALVTITTIGGVALQFPLGWLSDKMSRFLLTMASIGIFILLALALPYALHDTLATVVIAFFIGGVILGFYALGLATVGDRDSASDLAAMNAAYIISYQLGALVGPIFAGVAMTDSPVGGFVAIVTITMAVAGSALVALELNRRRTA